MYLAPTGDPALFAIVRLAVAVSLTATMLAAIMGAPLGAVIALTLDPETAAIGVARSGASIATSAASIISRSERSTEVPSL